MKRDIASVEVAPTTGWNYQEKWNYTEPLKKEHKPHYSPSYKQ